MIVSQSKYLVHISLVQKKKSFRIHPAKIEISKLRNFQTKKMFQFHKDKVCWSETILSFWSSSIALLQFKSETDVRL